MKKLLLISALALLVGCSSAEANDVADDGKCLDDIKHYNHLVLFPFPSLLESRCRRFRL